MHGLVEAFIFNTWLAHSYLYGSGRELRRPGISSRRDSRIALWKAYAATRGFRPSPARTVHSTAPRSETIWKSLNQKCRALNGTQNTRTLLVLEQPCVGLPRRGIDQLFADDDGGVLVCGDPGAEILGLLSEQLDVAPTIAESIANDLYRLVADSSADNAALPYAHRRRISVTETERHILERLDDIDPSSLNAA